MQIEKSQPKGERVMSQMKFTLFPALFIDPTRLRYLGLHLRPMIDYFSYLLLEKSKL